MNLNLQLGSFKFSLGQTPKPPPRPARRSFPGGMMSRLTNDWQSPSTSADAELKTYSRTLLYRCRQLERSNDYVRRYLRLVQNNVLGACGIGLQMKIIERPGIYDTVANAAIENAWRKWGKKATCSLNKRYSWRRIERLVLRSVVRDGGCLVRIIRTSNNPFGLTLQPLEIDYLDHDHNTLLANGNEIRMGIETSPSGEIVQYHLLTKHPGDHYQQGRRRITVPASDILHIMLPERIGQTVGIPQLVSSMLRLNMLEGYEEAEVTAAREGACKGGWIEKETPEEWVPDAEDESGNGIIDMEPGVIRELAPGQKFVEHDPKHPNTAYPAFVKQVLRGLASGLGVSYVSLANDLEGVNYSSIRAGLLDEREEWKELQESIIEDLHEQVFNVWLELSLMLGAITTPSGSVLPAKLQKFNMPEWKPRRWPWVDPEKDMRANVLAVEKGFDSRRNIIAESGRDIEDVFQEQSEDDKLADSYGLEFPTDIQQGGTPVDNPKESDG